MVTQDLDQVLADVCHLVVQEFGTKQHRHAIKAIENLCRILKSYLYINVSTSEMNNFHCNPDKLNLLVITIIF